MKVLFVTSEVAGLFKLGGLGDVSYALPVALSKLGVTVSVVLPYYEKIKLKEVTCVGQLAADFNRRREIIFVFKSFLPGSTVPVYLFRHQLFNNYRSKNIADTFSFFSKVVCQFYLYSNQNLGGPYNIVHCHDWHTALVPLLLGEQRKVGNNQADTLEAKQVKTIFTIHSHLYSGETGVMTILQLGLPTSLFHVYDTKSGRAIKLMREALEYADTITTVSPSYAQELITTEHGNEINEVMKRRADRVVGILNGIDQDVWNPQTDKAITAQYGKSDVFVQKAKNKKYVRHALKLPEKTVPLFGFIGRLEFRQKGLDFIEKMLAVVPKDQFQLVILGTGSPKSVEKLKKMIQPYDHVCFINTFDERLARRIYAGADVLLVPSRFEPCGLIQMIAMRYGTLPLVRKTGGLADSVTHLKTGFVFSKYQAKQFIDVIKKAINMYQHQPNVWQKMVQTSMRMNFSWVESAKKYAALYKKLAQ
ncbi:MAG: glycogen/starch synthase [Candidatus Gottesmanbacteria bacterium]